MIFAPNHHSHLDTGLMIRSVPAVWRRKMVVAAAADYFFDKRWKAAISALALNAIPIDREITGRKSSDMIRDLIDDGYSLVIYPGRRALTRRVGPGLQGRRGVPVGADRRAGDPRVHRRDRRDLRQGDEAPEAGSHQGRVRQPAVAGASTRAPAGSGPGSSRPSRVLGDEALTDFWTARRRAADGTSPTLSGPEYTGLAPRVGARRTPQHRPRRPPPPPERRWPDLG